MSDGASNYRFWIYLLVGIGLVLGGLFGYEFIYRYPIWTLHAFWVPSSSMCPTICEGERIFVEMRGEQPYVPQKGDVIVFKQRSEPANYIKRVIGVPGDLVAPGANNTILVNGQPWQAPSVCAKSLLPSPTNADASVYTGFKEIRVPPDQLFVIGDNLYNSFDSRIEQFGPVTSEQVLGRPVLIYWSPDGARIGCPVQ